jgi:ribosomal protein L29
MYLEFGTLERSYKDRKARRDVAMLLTISLKQPGVKEQCVIDVLLDPER